MISPQRRKLLEGLQEKIAVTFLNDALLSQSLTHSSYAHEVQGESKVRPSDNERLEFLGDAVLKVIISEYLYNKYPNYAEGDLTKIRATVVSDATLSAVAENQLELGTYLALGRNEKASGGAHRPSNLANALEALIAAIYLDQGIGKARDVVVALLAPEVERVSQKGFILLMGSTPSW
jgi:ribonuclease-3